MSETKFTPGPWRISRHGELVEIPEISGILLCAGNATANANAALIAAAPDLYAVVERYVDYLESELFHLGPPQEGHICGPEGNCDADCEIRYYLQRDLEQARAALAKARGEL